MLTEALGLLEWTAIGASVAAAMAALAVTLHAVLSHGTIHVCQNTRGRWMRSPRASTGRSLASGRARAPRAP